LNPIQVRYQAALHPDCMLMLWKRSTTYEFAYGRFYQGG
jgi:hypothetical protein